MHIGSYDDEPITVELMHNFAKENYENVVYINFKDNESAKKIFDGDFVINRITVDISALIPEAHFVPEKTIIIFDEIQQYPKARQSIKKLVKDGRYDYIETGSLISIRENVKGITIPSEEMPAILCRLIFTGGVPKPLSIFSTISNTQAVP